MKHIATMVLMLGLGVASVHAQERPVRMKFSGSMVPTSIVVQPNSITDEELLAGDGALGSFTFRNSAPTHLRRSLPARVPACIFPFWSRQEKPQAGCSANSSLCFGF
jgi:hypothetical protein